MPEKHFDQYIQHHKNLLIEGIKEYPDYFKPEFLIDFDRFSYETKKKIKKLGLLETWYCSNVLFEHPFQLINLNNSYLLEEKQDSSVPTEEEVLQVVKKQTSGLYQQYNAISQLKKFYERNKNIEELVNFRTKDGKTFEQELNELESQLKTIIPRIKKIGDQIEAESTQGGGLMNFASSKAQNLAGRLGVGQSSKLAGFQAESLTENRIMRELFLEQGGNEPQFNLGDTYRNAKIPFNLANSIRPDQLEPLRNAIRNAVKPARDGGTELPSDAINTLASSYKLSPQVIRGVAHQMVDPQTGLQGGIHVPGTSQAGFTIDDTPLPDKTIKYTDGSVDKSSYESPNTGTSFPTQAGQPPQPSQGSSVGDILTKGLGVAITAVGIGGLLAAREMKNRRERIENLIDKAEEVKKNNPQAKGEVPTTPEQIPEIPQKFLQPLQPPSLPWDLYDFCILNDKKFDRRLKQKIYTLIISGKV